MELLLSAAFSNFKIQINSIFDTWISITFKILFKGAGLVPVSEITYLSFFNLSVAYVASQRTESKFEQIKFGKVSLMFPLLPYILFYLGCQMMQAIYELFFLIFLKWVSSVFIVLMIHLQKGK